MSDNNTANAWRFFRAGGFDQVRLDSGEDIDRLRLDVSNAASDEADAQVIKDTIDSLGAATERPEQPRSIQPARLSSTAN